ncbi:MAG: RNA polymerase sigma factor [Solirubrobacteraceae bacterium]
MSSDDPEAGAGPVDRRLVAGVRAGSPFSFDRIVARYERPLAAFVRGRLPRATSVHTDDILQDVFLATYVRLRDTDAPMHLRAWLYRCAANACMDEHRRGSYAGSGPPQEARSEHPAEGRAHLRLVLGAVSRLPARQSDALLASAVHGWSYREIAAHLDLSEAAVKSLIHRGRRQLRGDAELADAA